MRKIRLFTATKPIESGLQIIIENNDFDYLAKVMRCKIGDIIHVFNGFDGEWSAQISQINKRNLSIIIDSQLRKQDAKGRITLAFAPVKNVRIDFVAAKATEMGVASFLPVITQHTIVDKINEDRFRANIKEATEQCERNDIPQLLMSTKLDKLLNDKNLAEKILILCDESGQGLKAAEVFKDLDPQKEIVIFIGPEGGFSKDEFNKMRALKNLRSLSLGKRILRSDTAIIAALALAQEFLPEN